MNRDKKTSFRKTGGEASRRLRPIYFVLLIASVFCLWCLLVPGVTAVRSAPPPDQIGPLAGTLWAQAYNGPANCCEQSPKIALDSSGSIYITGRSSTTREMPAGPFDDDIVTIKYEPKGKEAWVRRFAGPGHTTDTPQDITVDPKGNIYVTGTIAGVQSQFVTLKYSTSGDLIWARYAGGPLYNSPSALYVDLWGNVYVTGRSAYRLNTYNAPVYQFLTVKYDSGGNEIWQRTFETPQQQGAEAAAVTADKGGNVYVTGKGYLPNGVNLGHDIFTIKYSADGTELWTSQFTGDGPEYYNNDTASKLRFDGSNTLYVLGTTTRGPNQGDVVVLKYGNNGALLQSIVPSYSDNELSTDWAFDVDGSIYVESLKVVQNLNYTVNLDVGILRLDTGGGIVWRKLYGSTGGGNDYGHGIVLDGRGGVYIGVDAQQGTIFNENYVLVRYRASDGVKDSENSFDGPANDIDRLFAVAFDAGGFIYLTGESQADWDSNRSMDFLTLKVPVATSALP